MNNLNDLAARVHTANERWWFDIKTGEPLNRNVGELLMLTVSELAEALEGHRKDLMDDKLPHRKMFEVELADAIIRLLDIAGGFALELPMVRHTVHLTPNIGENLLIVSRLCVAAYIEQYSPMLFAIDLSQIIRAIEDLGDFSGVNVWAAFEEKMQYNAHRIDHTVAHRLAEGGKKY